MFYVPSEVSSAYVIVCTCRYGVVKIDSHFCTVWPHRWYTTKQLHWNLHYHCVFFCLTYYTELSDEHLMVVTSLMIISIDNFALH